jgi:hypothetical protein
MVSGQKLVWNEISIVIKVCIESLCGIAFALSRVKVKDTVTKK